MVKYHISGQDKNISTDSLGTSIQKFTEKYSSVYQSTKDLLYHRSQTETPILVEVMSDLYQEFISQGWISANPKVQYFFTYMKDYILINEKHTTLIEQLNTHLLDMSTYREADLCDNEAITDKVFVSTVHKAKGFEFDNVIIFEVTDGVYPFYERKSPSEIKESARLFYVAMTRAKKRLYILHCNNFSGVSRKGNFSIPKEPTRFLRSIRSYLRLD